MNNLPLSEFVRTTIVEIAKGINSAIEDLKDTETKINPRVDDKNVAVMKDNNSGLYRKVQEVEFDLLVSIETKKNKTNQDETSGKMSLNVLSILSIEFGGNDKSVDTRTKNNSYANRIKFSIPVSFSTNTRVPNKNKNIDFLGS
jgi:hypothetical protein